MDAGLFRLCRQDWAVAKAVLAAAVSNPTVERMDKLFRDVYGRTDTCLYGITQEDRLVAAAGIKRMVAGTAELLHIAVLPHQRQRGLGRTLVFEIVAAERLTELTAETDADAVEFYRKCGFLVSSLGEKYPGTERFVCRWIGHEIAT